MDLRGHRILTSQEKLTTGLHISALSGVLRGARRFAHLEVHVTSFPSTLRSKSFRFTAIGIAATTSCP